MLKCRLISLTVLLVSQFTFAQQNNTWYFGRKAGLNFNQSPPAVLHNSAMDADEGSASICDNNGNLLFYTNGVTVYNKNHQAMVNGTGLLGNISTVQSAVIIPMPGNTNLYYIFTADAIENNFANGYNYSIVDMTRDNGNGEVVTKNILLSAPGSERMAAVRHADGISVWLITNDKSSNIFRSWLINCIGISTTPVISVSGVILNTHSLMNTGMIKVSPDSKQLCQTHFPYLDEGITTPNFFQLFDFDNATGIISNGRAIDPINAQITSCEYSPDSKLLYISRAYDKKIDQLEAKLPTVAAILASKFTIDVNGATYFGIQLAPDKKIYLAEPSSYLGVINKPNIKGAGCNFEKQKIDVNEATGNISYAGLPNFINDLSFDGSNGFDYTILDSCTGTVRFNGISTMPGTIIWAWDFGDGNTSALQNPVHTFSAANQRYIVKVKIQTASGCGYVERSKEIIPKGLILNPGFDFTAKCDSGYVRFTNTSAFLPDTALIQYNWDFGDGNISNQPNPIHSFNSAGIFNVRLAVKTTTACLDKSISKPVNLELLDIQAPPDQEIDAGTTFQLNVTGGGSRFLWTPSNGLSNPAIANPFAKPVFSTMYVVTAFNDAGCKDSDSVFIRVKPIPGIYVPSAFTPNNDGKNDFFRPLVSDEFSLQEFSVYNRWGQKIFSTSQTGIGWNGKINGIVQDSGVYVWIVMATDTRSGRKIEKKGTFVIIR